MQGALIRCGRGEPWVALVIAALLVTATIAILLIAPEESTMGDAQRIVYVHVAVAWCALAGFVAAAGAGLWYLVRRNPAADHWALASAEVGWLCATLTLITGSLWAHEAWNTWWTWDPRLTTSLILWALYAGYFVLRGSIEDSRGRARAAAVLNLIGVLDVPLVVMATRWFRGIHPRTPEMEPTMRLVLLGSIVSFTALFAYLIVRRRNQLELLQRVESLERARPAASRSASI